MISKFIHTLRFKCNGIVYETTIEDDTDAERWKENIKRVKAKIFGPVNIDVLSSETFTRDEYDSYRNKIKS
ncbi:MAG: hypothetical protein J6T10_19400 [Methanobrevibacter sp.]|nr:hypothetical protein [Methanobrevibacter sp.]